MRKKEKNLNRVPIRRFRRSLTIWSRTLVKEFLFMRRLSTRKYRSNKILNNRYVWRRRPKMLDL